ncbi:lipase family protein [Vibrio maritimus]|uniref:lipase family protein n=1 Tax=Vibrio maritimus TaxID=990268 RepID=UPI0040691199
MEHFTDFEGVFAKTEYDERTSLSLAIACSLAYESEQRVPVVVAGWNYNFDGFINVIKQPDIDTQCFVMSNDDNIIVVFRGSESLKDWFANFQAVYDPGPMKGTKVHEGFQDALFPTVIGLTKIIESTDLLRKKIWVTGHSLGGALCSIFAGMLIENSYTVYGIYTFASPRPGNGIFEEKLNARVTGPHFRVVNFGDVVPHVPPEPFYSHPGNRVILSEEKTDTSSQSWFDQRVAALKVFISNTSNILDVADNHRLDADGESYIPRLIKDLASTKVHT